MFWDTGLRFMEFGVRGWGTLVDRELRAALRFAKICRGSGIGAKFPQHSTPNP